MTDELAALRSEVALLQKKLWEARSTSTRLNRRCQAADAAVVAALDDHKRSGLRHEALRHWFFVRLRERAARWKALAKRLFDERRTLLRENAALRLRNHEMEELAVNADTLTALTQTRAAAYFAEGLLPMLAMVTDGTAKNYVITRFVTHKEEAWHLVLQRATGKTPLEVTKVKLAESVRERDALAAKLRAPESPMRGALHAACSTLCAIANGNTLDAVEVTRIYEQCRAAFDEAPPEALAAVASQRSARWKALAKKVRTRWKDEVRAVLGRLFGDSGIDFDAEIAFLRGQGPDPVLGLDVVREAIAKASERAPIPMRLPCPLCGNLHIDEGEFETKPHHTHACQSCGAVWRPAVEATVGVRFLPGFKNEPAKPPQAADREET